MHTSREVASDGKSRFHRTGRRGQARVRYRQLGIEQLEDRRVLSGVSVLTAPAPITYGPIQPPATSIPTAGNPVGTALGGENTMISGDAPGVVAEYVEEKLGAPMLYIQSAAGNQAPIYTVMKDFKLAHLDAFKVILGDHLLIDCVKGRHEWVIQEFGGEVNASLQLSSREFP